MNKYYILSGELRFIVQAESPMFAALEACECLNGATIGDYFYIDERGFRDREAAHKIPMWDVIHEYSGELDEETQAD